MKRGMTIEYLKCRADLNFEVDFGVNGVIGTIVTSGILFYLNDGSFSSIKYFFFKYKTPERPWLRQCNQTFGYARVTKLHNHEFRGLKSHIDISWLYVCTVCACVYI